MLRFLKQTFTVLFLIAFFSTTTKCQMGRGGNGGVVAVNGNGNGNGNGGMSQAKRREENAFRSAKAKEVLKYMDLTADPCIDFYDFACGKWSENNRPESDGEILTVQSQVEQRVQKDLQLLLEAWISPQDVPAVRNAKDFYKSCTTVASTSQAQQDFLKNFVRKHGGLPSVPGTKWDPDYNWIDEAAKLRANYGLDILIGLEIDTNLHTKVGNSIFLTEPKSTLIPAELCSATATQETDIKDRKYNEIQQEVNENMKSWLGLNEDQADRFAADIVRFEFELCKKMRIEYTTSESNDDVSDGGGVEEGRGRRRNQSHRTGQSRLNNNGQATQYPKQSLHQWMKIFDGMINFKDYVDGALETPINDQVYMRSEAYFAHLTRVLRVYNKPTLANYIIYRALSVINFPRNDNKFQRPKYCVEQVLRYFPKIIGEMYNRKFYHSDSRNDVEQIFREMTNAFDKGLTVEWMEVNTKRAARQKLAQFRLTFPIYHNLNTNDSSALERYDYWRKLEIIMKLNAKQELNRLDSVEFPSRLENVEAFDVRVKLMSMENEIVAGLGILQPPFFHLFYPNSLKYSMIGQRIARELVLAFDEQSSNNHPISPQRWDEYTTENYRDLSECFRKQYSNYLYNNPDNFHNSSKLREIIADSGGLNVAFNAYLNWLEGMDSDNRYKLVKETLPEVDFTNTQLFFINFAQSRCAAKQEEEPPPEYLPLDRHTNERFDVNGPLANNVEFAREFGCAMGSSMNPDDKCVIF